MSKPRERINKKLTGCLRKYVVLGYERMITKLISKTNKIALQIISSEHNLIVIAGRETIGEQERRVLICLAPERLVAGIVPHWRNPMFGRGRINIRNMMWMK
jgi:hypothetical protein